MPPRVLAHRDEEPPLCSLCNQRPTMLDKHGNLRIMETRQSQEYVSAVEKRILSLEGGARMSFTVCPAAVIAAPVESVWELLTEPTLRDEWWDARTARVEPEGTASPGQVIYLKTLPVVRRWDATLTVERVDPDKHQIQWQLRGFGVSNQQTTTCTALDASSCRVQYG